MYRPNLLEMVRRVRYLVFRGRYTADLEEEMRLHIALREAKLVERGAAPVDAHNSALRRFGNRTSLRARSRDIWGLNWLDDALADIRFAVRRLRARPGFVLATILVAALGIGATTAVFSAIDAALIRPLPFARPDALVTLRLIDIPLETAGAPSLSTETQHYLYLTDVAKMHDLFSGVGEYASGGLNMENGRRPLRVNVGVVTAHLFALLGVSPERGREFTDDEGTPHGPRAVILSDAFWRGPLGGGDVLGTSIRLNGNAYTVVGIMPPSFSFPNESQLWIPLPVPMTIATFAPFRGYVPSVAFARLAPGVSIDEANAQMLSRWRQILHRNTGPTAKYDERTLRELAAGRAVRPLQRSLVGDARRAFVILSGAAFLLLLISCANVASMLLSDAAARRPEIALRAALGASQSRMVRQVLAESVMLASAGAALGLALAPAVLCVLRAMMPEHLAGIAPAQLDLRALAFAAALALGTGLAFGSWPAAIAARANAAEMIKSGGRGATSSLGSARRILMTAELALTVMLLVGSGLMIRSLARVLDQRMGMNPDHVGTLELSMPDAPRNIEMAKVHAIMSRLAAEPDVASAGVVNDLPLRGQGGISIAVTAPDAVKTPGDSTLFARYLVANGGYFEAMGIRLLHGRVFTSADDSLAPQVAVISETLARRLWPNADPVGKTLAVGAFPTPITVIGVVADVREQTLDGTVLPEMYFSLDASGAPNLALVARSTMPPKALLGRLRDAVRAADPSQPVFNVRTMDDVISADVAPRRTNTTLIAMFGAIALALAAFGVYAVVSYGVTRRAREFGVRAALGATGRDIAALVGREIAWILALGLTLGLAGAWTLSRVLGALLYEVSGHDVASFALAPLVLLLSALVATLVPACRAMRIDPSDVMRAE